MVREQLQTIIDRAADRGEVAPPADDMIDAIVAPMIYRILYAECTPAMGGPLPGLKCAPRQPAGETPV